jgi:hypothetical protein
MTRISDYEDKALKALNKTVAKALERKRRLGISTPWFSGTASRLSGSIHGPKAPVTARAYRVLSRASLNLR